MTSILKGLAALIAAVTVNVGGAHVGIVNKPIHLSHVAPRATAQAPLTATTDPVGSDAFQMRGRTQVTVFPPTPDPAETPAETPAENQPLAQLPIAAPASGWVSAGVSAAVSAGACCGGSTVILVR